MITVLTSGEGEIEVEGTDWEPLLEIPGTTIIDAIVIHNEGDWSGYWRLTQDGQSSPGARLAAGSGDPGERRAVTTVPCKGFSGGRLEVKRGLGGGFLTGLFAWAVRE